MAWLADFLSLVGEEDGLGGGGMLVCFFILVADASLRLLPHFSVVSRQREKVFGV